MTTAEVKRYLLTHKEKIVNYFVFDNINNRKVDV